MKYLIARQDGIKSLSVVLESENGTEIHSVTNSNPFWEDIVDAILDNDEDTVRELITDIPSGVNRTFQSVTERVSLKDGVVYFDGDPIHNSLADAIARAEGKEELLSLARFMEKCYTNPRKHSRDNLFDWLNTHDFTITVDGDLVGYKGVNDNLRSLSSGPGIVNGVETNGNLDNAIGNVLEMARSSVEHDPSRGCSTGLHVGTWEYASGFGPRTLRVIVNPRDVVSVPTDCSWAKMRVCRYTVDAEIDQPNTSFVYHDEDSEDYWGEDEGWVY